MSARQLERNEDDSGSVVWRVAVRRNDDLQVLLETDNEHRARRLFDDAIARAKADQRGRARLVGLRAPKAC